MNDNSDALDNLARLKHEAFKGDDEQLALALGRPVDEVRLWLTSGAIDENAQEQISSMAQERLSE